MRTGSLETALASVEKGINLEPNEPEYRLTLARILGEGGDTAQAIGQVRGVIEWGKAPPHVVARAYCLWGDFMAAAKEHEYTEAIKTPCMLDQAGRAADSQPTSRGPPRPPKRCWSTPIWPSPTTSVGALAAKGQGGAQMDQARRRDHR